MVKVETPQPLMAALSITATLYSIRFWSEHPTRWPCPVAMGTASAIHCPASLIRVQNEPSTLSHPDTVGMDSSIHS